jgi:hypothetical protein
VKPHQSALLAAACLAAVTLPLAVPTTWAQPTAVRPKTDLDVFMARVLERRDENWKKLHDYILSETERFALSGPGRVPLYGFRREFSWYVRDGYLIRSPIRFDGVTIADPERRRYEERWLSEEKAREARQNKDVSDKADPGAPATGELAAPVTDASALEGMVTGRVEPRFVSEAYFLRFKFEPGNYYFVGREQLDGREVVRIEYYPTQLFKDDERPAEEHKPAGKPDKEAEKERQVEDRVNRGLNKVALVTLWIEPTEFQIVRYTFDNVDFGFLPGRWLVRVDHVSASMTMGKVLDGVWLPRSIEMRADLSMANGGFHFEYGREFYDHKKAEVSARIRIVGGERR